MSTITPLEKLDDAIREYVEDVEGGNMSGWVLGYQTRRIQDDPGFLAVQFSSDMTFAPATSPETALGLARMTSARIENELLHGEDES